MEVGQKLPVELAEPLLVVAIPDIDITITALRNEP